MNSSFDCVFFVRLTASNRSSSVIVKDGVWAAATNTLNIPFVKVNLPPQALNKPSMTPVPSALILVKPFAVYLSSETPPILETVCSQVLAADMKPPAFADRFNSVEVAFKP